MLTVHMPQMPQRNWKNKHKLTTQLFCKRGQNHTNIHAACCKHSLHLKQSSFDLLSSKVCRCFLHALVRSTNPSHNQYGVCSDFDSALAFFLYGIVPTCKYLHEDSFLSACTFGLRTFFCRSTCSFHDRTGFSDNPGRHCIVLPRKDRNSE